jgi:hypothetical protein
MWAWPLRHSAVAPYRSSASIAVIDAACQPVGNRRLSSACGRTRAAPIPDASCKSVTPIRAAIGATTISAPLLTYTERARYDGYARREKTNEALLGLQARAHSVANQPSCPHPSSPLGKGRIVRYGRQYQPVEDSGRDGISVVETVHDDNEIEDRHDEQALAATAESGDPSQFATVQQ